MSRRSRGTPEHDAYLDLKNRAQREKRPTQELLQLYVLEAFPSRLAASEVREDDLSRGAQDVLGRQGAVIRSSSAAAVRSEEWASLTVPVSMPTKFDISHLLQVGSPGRGTLLTLSPAGAGFGDIRMDPNVALLQPV